MPAQQCCPYYCSTMLRRRCSPFAMLTRSLIIAVAMSLVEGGAPTSEMPKQKYAVGFSNTVEAHPHSGVQLTDGGWLMVCNTLLTHVNACPAPTHPRTLLFVYSFIRLSMLTRTHAPLPPLPAAVTISHRWATLSMGWTRTRPTEASSWSLPTPTVGKQPTRREHYHVTTSPRSLTPTPPRPCRH